MSFRDRKHEAPTVLVIEDDEAIREGLVDALEFEGYAVDEARTAPDGQDLALRSPCAIVLLDLMLPGGDGFEVLKAIRRARPQLPVIILTARGREAERVQGLRPVITSWPFRRPGLQQRHPRPRRQGPERQALRICRQPHWPCRPRHA